MLRLHYSDWRPRITAISAPETTRLLLRHRIGAISRTKVRQSDRTSDISVRTVEGQSILVLASDYDGILYETWVLHKDGSLLELFSGSRGSGLTVEDSLP